MKQRYNELNHDLCVRAVLDAFDGKWKRQDVVALVNKYGGVRYGEIADALRRGLSWPMLEAADGVALELEQRILDLLSGDPEAMDFEPVTVRLRPDGMTGKMRAIADLCPMLQIAGHLVKLGIEPLLKAKIEYGQCASIPGRGQTGLKRRVERWLRRKSLGIRHAQKTDVSNAYGSLMYAVCIGIIRSMIPSAKWILAVLSAIAAIAPGGHLIIGGYLDAWLFNLVMSYAVRYVLSLCKQRRGQRVPLVVRVVTHMDDFGLLGKREADAKSAARRLAQWMEKELGLCLKLGASTNFLNVEEEHRRRKLSRPAQRGCPSLDMGGFRMHRTYTTIRKRIFIRGRRAYLRAGADLTAHRPVRLQRAQRVQAYYGDFKHTASRRVRGNLGVDSIKMICSGIISRANKRRKINAA